MRFYIMDDRENDHTFVSAAMKTAFPDAVFAVDAGTTFARWGAVSEYLRAARRDIEKDESILLLDMSLGEDDPEAQIDEGIRRARTLRLEFPTALVVACTQYDLSVASKVRRGDNPFDGVFAKERWRALPDAERPNYVRTIIEGARPRSSSLIGALRERFEHDDSLGLRSFCAAFGDGAIDELIVRFADATDAVHIRALTGGLSGAFLFEIKTNGARGRLSRIVKLARDRDLIEKEVTGLATHLPALGQLATVLLPPIGEIMTIPCGAFYLEQIAVEGEDLLRLARRDLVAGSVAIRKYVSVLSTCVADAIGSPGAVRRMPLGQTFSFSHLDLERLRVSAEFLSGFGRRLVAAGQWPVTATPAEAAASLLEIASAWRKNELPVLSRETPVHPQHGDAHLANVMLTATGQMRLIDLARVGVWPIGYDMSRPAVQARLRLLDHVEYADFMPEHIPTWMNGGMAGSGDVALADEFVNAFKQTIANSEFAEELALAFDVGTAWDLLKIASYGDISPSKRVWAMLYATQFAGMLRANGPARH